MKKSEFFLAAMDAGEYRRRAWVISAFALIKEGPEQWRANPYPYRIVQSPTGFFYVSPEDTSVLLPIENTVAGEPLFKLKDRIFLKAKSLPNLEKDVDTTYGNVLFNFTILIYPFFNKLPYMEGRVKIPQVEDLIINRLRDDPAEGEERKDEFIYIDEYIKYANAAFHLAGFTQLCVPAATRKSMTCSPEIPKIKARLLEENKDRLHDPATIAKIDAELVKYDREVWMKGDLAEGFLINDKSFNTVRKKLFLMHGAEVGLDEGVGVDLIENSLSQGWDIKKFPAMNNSLRAGSFNRGAQTMLGGEEVKWLLRASSNLGITADDCGTKLGRKISVDGDNYKSLIGFSLVEKIPTGFLNEQMAKTYIGKTVLRRSMMFCKLPKTDYCAQCAGQNMSENPTGLSVAVAGYGSAFLSMFMSAAHSKALLLAKMDYKTALF